MYYNGVCYSITHTHYNNIILTLYVITHTDPLHAQVSTHDDGASVAVLDTLVATETGPECSPNKTTGRSTTISDDLVPPGDDAILKTGVATATTNEIAEFESPLATDREIQSPEEAKLEKPDFQQRELVVKTEAPVGVAGDHETLEFEQGVALKEELIKEEDNSVVESVSDDLERTRDTASAGDGLEATEQGSGEVTVCVSKGVIGGGGEGVRVEESATESKVQLHSSDEVVRSKHSSESPETLKATQQESGIETTVGISMVTPIVAVETDMTVAMETTEASTTVAMETPGVVSSEMPPEVAEGTMYPALTTVVMEEEEGVELVPFSEGDLSLLCPNRQLETREDVEEGFLREGRHTHHHPLYQLLSLFLKARLALAATRAHLQVLLTSCVAGLLVSGCLGGLSAVFTGCLWLVSGCFWFVQIVDFPGCFLSLLNISCPCRVFVVSPPLFCLLLACPEISYYT